MAATAADVREIPGATVFRDNLATLQGHADTLGVPLHFVVRHAIRVGMTQLATDISALGASEGLKDLDDAVTIA